jgi:hypothetical protein
MITLLGWVGALLALAAYAQTGTIRFRQIALLSSVALLTFAVLLGIWSNVVLESALGIVNVRRLLQLRTSPWRWPERLSRGRRAARPKPGRQPAGRAPTGRTTGLALPDVG